ncbi:MAG: TIGR04283 family arsenosugar biosynthesis glycosyltransferase, partial [Bacteroidota bacterium]
PPFPWLSIIIPTLNEEDTLVHCLARIYARAVPGQFEVIISDGGSTDKTLEIVSGYTALTTLHSTRGRAQQLNLGAQQAQGQFLWFLHADTLPPENWWYLLQQARRDQKSATFSVYFSEQESSALLRFYAWGSSLNHWSVRFGDQSLFVSKAVFKNVGGYREDYLLMEGHELARRLQKSHGLHLLPAAVTTSSRRYFEHGIIFTQAIFTLIFSLHYLGWSQARLLRIYRWAFGRPSLTLRK